MTPLKSAPALWARVLHVHLMTEISGGGSKHMQLHAKVKCDANWATHWWPWQLWQMNSNPPQCSTPLRQRHLGLKSWLGSLEAREAKWKRKWTWFVDVDFDVEVEVTENELEAEAKVPIHRQQIDLDQDFRSVLFPRIVPKCQSDAFHFVLPHCF